MEAQIALALIQIAEREAPVKIAIDDGAMKVIGVETLEALGLKVNPITGKLEPPESLVLFSVMKNELLLKDGVGEAKKWGKVKKFLQRH
jgi:hypothetical protein